MTAYRIPADVAWVETTDPERLVVVAARVPDGPPLALDGASAAIWLAAVEGGDEEAILARVVELSGQERATIETSVRWFLRELAAFGLLSASGQSSSRPRR